MSMQLNGQLHSIAKTLFKSMPSEDSAEYVTIKEYICARTAWLRVCQKFAKFAEHDSIEFYKQCGITSTHELWELLQS